MTTQQPFQYILLLASLPSHPLRLFDSELSQPVSRLQLERRLAWLTPEHADLLARIEAVLHWSRLNDQEEAAVMRKTQGLIAHLPEGPLRELVTWRLDLRGLIAALRRRHLDYPPPGPHDAWNVSRWNAYIRLHWQTPDFALGSQMPWLNTVWQHLQNGEALALEKLLLTLTWSYYVRITERHAYDFVAVVIYVLRWDILQRWAHYDAQKAQTRFDHLVECGLGEYAKLFS